MRDDQPMMFHNRPFNVGLMDDVCPTLTMEASKMPGMTVVIPTKTICLQGDGIDRADTAGCNGKGWCEDVCYTLNTIDRPAVVAFMSGCGATMGGIQYTEEASPPLKTSHPPEVAIINSAGFLCQMGAKAKGIGYEEQISPTLLSGALVGVVVDRGDEHGLPESLGLPEQETPHD